MNPRNKPGFKSTNDMRAEAKAARAEAEAKARAAPTGLLDWFKAKPKPTKPTKQ